MDDGTSVMIVVLLGITLCGALAIYSSFESDHLAIKAGLHQEQVVGGTGYIWVK